MIFPVDKEHTKYQIWSGIKILINLIRLLQGCTFIKDIV